MRWIDNIEKKHYINAVDNHEQLKWGYRCTLQLKSSWIYDILCRVVLLIIKIIVELLHQLRGMSRVLVIQNDLQLRSPVTGCSVRSTLN